jgi:lipid-A-disaccharide synthase
MKQQIGSARVHLASDARTALLHARTSVVASGTATVEAALIGNPFIVVYRVSGLSYAIGKRLVKVKNFGMVNLIAGREIVPELIQANFTAEKVVEQLRTLVSDGARREEMIRELQGVQSKLRQVAATTETTAIARAAHAVLDVISEKRA